MKSAIAIILFHIYIKTVMTELIVKPSNTASVLRQSARFDCSTNNTEREIQWFHYPMGAKDRSIVHGYSAFHPPYVGRFQLQQNTGQGVYNLVISPINETDAGGYECQDDGGFGEKSRAELTVLKTDLVCASNVSNNVIIGPNNCGIQPDVLQFSCSVSYLGNADPILEWSQDGDSNLITEGVTRDVSNRLVTYKLTKEVDAGTDGHYYMCQTKKSITGPQNNCRSEVIKVWNMPHGSSLVEKTKGKSIQCAPEMEQSPCSFQWSHLDHNGEKVVSTNRSVTPADPGLYRCQVDCTIKGKKCSSLATMGLVTSCVEQPVEGYIAGLVILAVLVILLLVFLFCVQRSKKKGEKTKKELRAEITRLEDQIAKKDSSFRNLDAQMAHDRDEWDTEKKKLEEQLRKAREDMKTMKKEHQEEVKILNTEKETMKTKHQEEVKNLKKKHQEEVKNLNDQLNQARNEKETLAKQLTTATRNQPRLGFH